jgi:hypothetical protein
MLILCLIESLIACIDEQQSVLLVVWFVGELGTIRGMV